MDESFIESGEPWDPLKQFRKPFAQAAPTLGLGAGDGMGVYHGALGPAPVTLSRFWSPGHRVGRKAGLAITKPGSSPPLPASYPVTVALSLPWLPHSKAKELAWLISEVCAKPQI